MTDRVATCLFSAYRSARCGDYEKAAEYLWNIEGMDADACAGIIALLRMIPLKR
jgi:hypothetical protein